VAKFRLVALLLVYCGLAAANSIIVQSVDTPLGEQQTLWIDENGTNTQLYWAGGINVSVDGTTRVMWCVQLFVDINLNTTYNTVVDWANTPQLQRIGWLVQNVAGFITTQAQGAALQLAIWDISEDNADGFTAGKVRQSTSNTTPTDPVVLALAKSYETQSATKLYEWVPVYHDVTVIGGTPVQNLIGPLVKDDVTMPTAPEPGDWVMALGGLALIVGARWWRSRAVKPVRPRVVQN
jgi:hypothetical protein